jgi:hypothetical protein
MPYRRQLLTWHLTHTYVDTSITATNSESAIEPRRILAYDL